MKTILDPLNSCKTVGSLIIVSSILGIVMGLSGILLASFFGEESTTTLILILVWIVAHIFAFITGKGIIKNKRSSVLGLGYIGLLLLIPYGITLELYFFAYAGIYFILFFWFYTAIDQFSKKEELI